MDEKTLTSEEIKMLGICAAPILRLLKSKEDRIIARIYGEFRNGKNEHLSSIAELACLRDLAHEIKAATGRLGNQGG